MANELNVGSTQPLSDAAKIVLGTTGAVEKATQVKVAYTLYYRSTRSPHSQAKNFYLPTNDMRIAIERAKRHCELVGIRFVLLVPMWTDLEQEEKAMMRGQD